MRSIRKMSVWLFVAAGGLSAAPGPRAQNAAASDGPPPLVRLEATFASVGAPSPKCEALPLFFRDELHALPADLHPHLHAALEKFDSQLASIAPLQASTDEARKKMRFAVLRVLRLVEESSAKLVNDYQSGSYLNTLWDAAELKYHVGQAEQETLDSFIEYYWRLWELTSAQQALRAAAAEYYQLIERGYPVFPEASRAETLRFLRTRMNCLSQRREQVFCILAQNRREFWKSLNDRAWTAVLGRDRPSAVSGEKPVCGVVATAPAEEDPIADLADALLSSALLDEEYAWLAPETTTTADILSSLLDREEDACSNRELKELIDRALEQGFGSDEAERLARQPLSDQLRMKIFAMRIERARLVLERKMLGLEAAFRRQTSVMLGLGEAFSKAWEQGAVSAGGLATAEAMKGFEPHLKSLALVAITQKLLGDSFSLLVTTPLQDALTDVAFKPVWGFFGEEVKNSLEKAWGLHKEQSDDLKRKQALLADLIKNIRFVADAAPYVEALTRGDPQASPIGRRAPATLRSLLEDSDFIAATNGGLPWIFEIFCNRESQRTALLLYGASYELEANARIAAVRVAAMRGLPVESPDLKLTRESFEQIFKPGQPPPALSSSADRLIDCMPVIGDLWRVYNLPSAVTQTIDFLHGNLRDQDGYLKALVDYQQSFRVLLEAMAAVDFDYGRLQRERSAVYTSDHMALLNGSSEYANAYRLIRFHETELEKRLVLARHRDADDRSLTPRGKASLTSIQSRQDLDSADFAVRAAYAKLVNHALTGSYAAAAAQTRSLEALESQKRKLLGTSDRVDLSGVAHAFEAEAARREMVEVYRGLYQSAVRETVLSLATDAMADKIMDAITNWVGVRFIAESGDLDVGAKLYEQLNPWAQLFSEEGVFNTLQSGFENAAKSSTAQILAQKQNVFSETEIEGAIDLVYEIARDVGQNVRKTVDSGTPERVLDRSESEARQAALNRQLDELEAFHRAEIEPLLRRLDQIGDDPDFEFQREQIIRQIAEREAAPQAVMLRQALAALAADANLSYERQLEAEDEEEEAAAQIAANVVEVEARNRARDADNGSAEERTAACAAATAEAISRLKRDAVEVEDLRRLTDPEDPSGLHRRLLSPELDIGTLRSALRRAKRNQPDRAAEINAIATELDRERTRLVDRLVNEFIAESGLGDRIVAVLQGGAAEGNPEHQGIFGDFDFTVFVAPGAGDNVIKEQILAFFKERNFQLALTGVTSPMDTETFVQPAGRLEAATTPFQVLITDAAVKRKDATRFFSEGGGKWALNNYAYSGRLIWGNSTEVRRWTPAEPREGYGLALDMARHLGFLSDPRNMPDRLASMTPEQRRTQLGCVLRDSKYFLRLVDACLMGHDGLGNRLYNNRMQWRQETGPDSSYHLQIAKDVEALVMPGGGAEGQRLAAVTGGLEGAALEVERRSVFTEADLPFVKLLAEMKLKGEHPDPWDVVPGDSPEGKAANASALAEWMRDLAPRILAETAAVWQREHEWAVTSGNEDRIRTVRTDAHRIATTCAAARVYDVVGAKGLLRPPARFVERQDESGRTRIVDQRLDREEHLAELRRGIDEDRARRQQLLDEVAARQAAVRRRYPPEEELTDEDRNAIRSEMEAVVDLVQARAQNVDEDSPANWFLFWLRR